jgi:hypothetical protein
MERVNDDTSPPVESPDDAQHAAARRAALKKLGRYAAVTAPAVTLLLAAALKPKQAVAAY